jgi:hypothetical protein
MGIGDLNPQTKGLLTGFLVVCYCDAWPMVSRVSSDTWLIMVNHQNNIGHIAKIMKLLIM